MNRQANISSRGFMPEYASDSHPVHDPSLSETLLNALSYAAETESILEDVDRAVRRFEGPADSCGQLAAPQEPPLKPSAMETAAQLERRLLRLQQAALLIRSRIG